MDALAADAAAESGLAFVRPALDAWIGQSQLEGLRRVPLETPPLTDEDSARVDELEGQIEELVDALQDDGTEEAARDAADARIRVLSAEIDTIVNKPPQIDPQLKGQVGTFLVLDDDGKPKLATTFYAQVTEGDAPDASGDDGGDPSAETNGESGRSAGLSQRLVDELSMQRRDILAVHVAADPGLALDLAIFLMVDREAGYSAGRSGSSLNASPPSNPVLDFRTPEAAATIAAAEASEALDRSWTELNSRVERFDAFRALGDEARAAWLGHAVARTLEASLNLAGERACAFHDHLGGLLGIDVARWWRPTGANYFDRVPKSVTLAALAEVGGEALAGRFAKAKKAELAQSCERIFAGDFIADVEVKQAALAWVPEAMRFGPGEAAAPDEAATAGGPDSGPGGSVPAEPIADPVAEVEEAA
jgi:ParB family chromosome partitioning protein